MKYAFKYAQFLNEQEEALHSYYEDHEYTVI